MRDSGQALRHAQAAVDRAADIAAHYRSEAERSRLSRQQRLMFGQAAQDLDRRRAVLADLHARLTACQAADLPENWKRFFDCYDAFLESAERHRLQAIESESAESALDTKSDAEP